MRRDENEKSVPWRRGIGDGLGAVGVDDLPLAAGGLAGGQQLGDGLERARLGVRRPHLGQADAARRQRAAAEALERWITEYTSRTQRSLDRPRVAELLGRTAAWAEQEIEGFQSNIFTGSGFVLLNAGKQSTFGVEFEGTATIADALTLNLGVTYLDPVYDSFQISAVGDLSGTRPAGIPEWSVVIGAQSRINRHSRPDRWFSIIKMIGPWLSPKCHGETTRHKDAVHTARRVPGNRRIGAQCRLP